MRFPGDVPTLTDGVVTLRAHTEADVPRIVEQCNDPLSVTGTTVPQPYVEQDALDWLGRAIPKGWSEQTALILAVEFDGRFAGSVDLRLRGGGEAEIGYGLHPDARGDGVMRRALDLLLDWAFAEQGVVVVHWRANAGNWPSRRVAWSLGFRFGPTIPRLLAQRGERHDGWTAWLGAGDPRRPASPWLEPVVLESGPVRLRPWRDDDGPRLVEAANDPLLQVAMPLSPLPREAAGLPAYLLRVREMAAEGRRVAWCVADRGTDVALGGVALADVDGDTAQVGYWSHPEGRGRGLMTEAVRTITDHALRSAPAGLGLRRLFLLTALPNTASQLLAERAGFTRVGTERASAVTADGGFADNALYDRLRD